MKTIQEILQGIEKEAQSKRQRIPRGSCESGAGRRESANAERPDEEDKGLNGRV